MVPLSFVQTLYNDLEFESNQSITATAYHDYSGQGDFRLYAAIRSQGAVSIYYFDETINADDRIATFERNDDQTHDKI